MKCAIWGAEPKAILAAAFLHHLGAEVTLYAQGVPLRNLSLLAGKFPEELLNPGEIPGPWMDLLSGYSLKFPMSLGQFAEGMGKVLGHLPGGIKVNQNRVLRIQKCHLRPGEVPREGSRMIDLFRVFTRVEPESVIENDMSANEEVFSKLSERIIKSLKDSHETYADYDVVIDARENVEKVSVLGFSGGAVLNESTNGQRENVFYGEWALTAGSQPGPGNVTLVGDTSIAARWILLLEEWLRKDGNVLNIVCEQEGPFTAFKKEAGETPLKNSLDSFFIEEQKTWKKKTEDFERGMREFRDSDDPVVKRKGPPSEPVPSVNLFQNYSVCALDYMEDHEKLYVTLEKVPFRGGETAAFVTLPSEWVVGCRPEVTPAIESPVTDEPGLYRLRGSQDMTQCLKCGMTDIMMVVEDLKKYFSRKS